MEAVFFLVGGSDVVVNFICLAKLEATGRLQPQVQKKELVSYLQEYFCSSRNQKKMGWKAGKQQLPKLHGWKIQKSSGNLENTTTFVLLSGWGPSPPDPRPENQRSEPNGWIPSVIPVATSKRNDQRSQFKATKKAEENHLQLQYIVYISILLHPHLLYTVYTICRSSTFPNPLEASFFWGLPLEASPNGSASCSEAQGRFGELGESTSAMLLVKGIC